MTELTFLLDLLLNHKLPMATKVAVTERIKEVEARLAQGYSIPRNADPRPNIAAVPAHLANQAPSTIAAMMKHPDLVAQMSPTIGIAPQEPSVAPVQVIAQTPAAQAALNARQEAINGALSGKPEKGRTSPRKF